MLSSEAKSGLNSDLESVASYRMRMEFVLVIRGMEVNVKVLSRTARNVAFGLVFAFAISFGSVRLGASCQAAVGCGEEMGDVSCVCEGPGSCSSNGSAVCACDGYPTVTCNCQSGCTP